MRSSDRLNMVVDLIEQDLKKELDTKAIAAVAGCSFEQFQRIFAFFADMPLYEYVRRRRLTLAAVELKKGGKSVTEIGLEYGYATPSGFTRAFKDLHGVSPTAAMAGEGTLNMLSRLTVPSPNYTGQRYYRVVDGEVTMARLDRIEYKAFGPYRVIGRSFEPVPLSNDIPQEWGRFFGDGSSDVLHALAADERWQTPLPNAHVGHIQGGGEGRCTYTIGVVFAAGTPVPEGFDHIDIPAGHIAEGWVTGFEYDLYEQGMQLVVNAAEGDGQLIRWDGFWHIEAYTEERFEAPKRKGAKETTLDYYVPLLT